MTRHVPVVVVGDAPGTPVPCTGRMLAQPMVEAMDDARFRLDDALGPWFALVGFECDPLATLTADEAAAGPAADIGPELSRLVVRFLLGGQR